MHNGDRKIISGVSNFEKYGYITHIIPLRMDLLPDT